MCSAREPATRTAAFRPARLGRGNVPLRPPSPGDGWRLRAEARVGHFHVVIGLARERKLEPCVQLRPRAIVAARQLLAGPIENSHHGIDRRSQTPRLHLEDAPLSGLAGHAIYVALGTA